MNLAQPAPNFESARLLGRLADRSKRKSGIQLPVGFIRTEDPKLPPPLTRMLRGGRGGAVRLKLYLCMSLVASRSPYDIRSIPSRAWAETLALPEPSTLGARRVADAIKWLGDEKMIAVARRQGAAPTVTLLDPLGTGLKYSRPAKQWVTVPLGFWRQQWITALSGSAVALLIILLDLQGGRKSAAQAPSLSTDQRLRYSLSDDTWTRATSELVSHDLLDVRRVAHGRDFDWKRMRNTYWIRKGRLDQLPDSLTAPGTTDAGGYRTSHG
jgi:hypothetical protein